jgi:hypothetical protein
MQKCCACCRLLSASPVHASAVPSTPAIPRPAAPVLQITEQYRGEQLAYIAAFTIGAKLVYGDRPKDITLRWGGGCAAWCCTAAQLLPAGLGAHASGAPASWQQLATATACLRACSTMLQHAQACSSCRCGVCWCLLVHPSILPSRPGG